MLSHNNLQNIGDNTFSPMEKLDTLYLSFNPNLQFNPSSWGGLQNLKWLYAESIGLTELTSEMWRSLSSLRYLKLDNNYIAVLDKMSLEGLDNLDTLEMMGNRSVCIMSIKGVHSE